MEVKDVTKSIKKKTTAEAGSGISQHKLKYRNSTYSGLKRSQNIRQRPTSKENIHP